MEDIMQNLTEEELAEVVGGIKPQYDDPNGAHWRFNGVSQGQTFEYNGHTWYCIKYGDWLGKIALEHQVAEREGITGSAERRALQGCYILKRRNPNTIKDIRLIYAGDCIVLY